MNATDTSGTVGMTRGAHGRAATMEGVLLYDADCGFCIWSLDRGSRLLRVMPTAEPWQSADLAGYGIRPAQAEAALQFVSLNGGISAFCGPVAGQREVVSGHLAVAALLLGQPVFAWRFLGALLTIPPFSWLAAAGYHWIAGHRHLLPGSTAACAVPPAATTAPAAATAPTAGTAPNAATA